MRKSDTKVGLGAGARRDRAALLVPPAFNHPYQRQNGACLPVISLASPSRAGPRRPVTERDPRRRARPTGKLQNRPGALFSRGTGPAPPVGRGQMAAD